MPESRHGAEHVAGAADATPEERRGFGRRRFLTWVMAAPVLTIGAKNILGGTSSAQAQVPKVPQYSDEQDLAEQLALANEPTRHMVKLEVLEDSTVRLHLHRMEVGQGITTAMAMLVADEMGVPFRQVDVVLRDAAPELVFNQLTGGSASMRHLYVPVRQAAAAARDRLLGAASQELDIPLDQLSMGEDGIEGPGGPWPIGAFTALAVNYELPDDRLERVKAFDEQGALIGTPTRRLDTLEAVTGQRTFAMDVDVPDAKPMMVRRPDSIMGGLSEVLNADEVRAMSGVIDVIELPGGVGVVADTFGQAEVAKNALRVDWADGPHVGQDDDDISEELKSRQLPLSILGLDPLLGTPETYDLDFSFPFVSHGPMETNTAVADVRGDSAEFWCGLKIPIIALQDMAKLLGLNENQVEVNVVPAGGSFGRRLFHDALDEAAIASQRLGIPIKNMWTRLDDIRHGRGRPPSEHRLRATMLGDDVVGYEQRMSGIALSGEHGLGESLSAALGREANVLIAQDLFLTLAHCPYDFGVVTQLLNEPNTLTMNTGSWRSPYSNVLRPAEEIMVDELAERVGEGPLEFRLRMLESKPRGRAVLKKVAELADWGKDMPNGTAQGIGFHEEYNSYSAWLVEIDARDESDPRVTRATCVVDVGNPINPSGLEQQMLGGLADGIGLALQLGNHVRDGAIVESSYADFRITKQRHFPSDTQVVVLPASTDDVGGAGELGLSGATAAIANAYAAATGRQVRSLPVNFDIDFDVVPDVPTHPTFDA